MATTVSALPKWARLHNPMSARTLQFDALSHIWRGVQEKVAPAAEPACVHARTFWRRLTSNPATALLSGSRFCLDECLQPALEDALRKVRSKTKPASVNHRVPLGLMLLSRQQVTPEQLTEALDAQRVAGRGRIGEWLIALGCVSEEQVIAAVARQWSCPVLRPSSSIPRPDRLPPIPLALMQVGSMIPIGYVPATATLYFAFGECIDHNLLYSVERMTDCHTEPCFAAPSFIQHALLSLMDQKLRREELVFECESNLPELARIVRSYCARLSAREIRIVDAGAYTWIRLLRGQRLLLDLLFRAPIRQDHDC